MYQVVDEKHLFYNNKLLPRLSANVCGQQDYKYVDDAMASV